MAYLLPVLACVLLSGRYISLDGNHLGGSIPDAVSRLGKLRCVSRANQEWWAVRRVYMAKVVPWSQIGAAALLLFCVVLSGWVWGNAGPCT